MGLQKLGLLRAVLPRLSILAISTVILTPAVAQFNPCMPDNPLVTPPPRPDNKPVISDGIIYYLDYVPQHCQCPRVERYPSGGVIKDSRAIIRVDNPHIIQGNIEIAPTGCLYIQPGSQLRFHPGFGIIVNGTLISRGSEEPGGRIVMTKAEGQDTGAPTGAWADDARLVEGNTTQDGRLGLLFRGKWRGICNNYNNWTAIDANVTCRHLGFLKGNFTYHSYSRNYTAYMLYTAPRCLGTENSLLQCPGALNIQYGDHICDGQQLVGFECEGLRPGLAVDHWRGLEFYNSSVEASYRDDNVFMNRTHSWVEYTDILYAGLDMFHGLGNDVYYPRAAISASPYVPVFNNVTVKYCAYDAFNLTEVRGDIHIANSTIAFNRGHGIFVQTSFGQVLVNMTNVTNNWGDGVKVYLVNITQHDFPKQFPFDSSFCRAPDLANQAYPALLYQDVISPSGEKPLGSECGRRFTTRGLKQITAHVMMVERDPLASGTLEFYDGGLGGRLMACMPINNGSLPQSLTTKTQTLYVRFKFNLPANYICPTYKPCIRFLMELHTGYGPAEDFALIYSKVSDNIGYGVNIQDMRSKVFFNTSIVSFNQYGAGIRIYQGAGEVAINNTHIEGNEHCGVNITYSGGYQMFNNSNIIANRGYGVITEYLLVNRSRFEIEQRMEVVRGRFELNELIALRVGNYCRGGSVLVNESTFAFNLDEAIEFVSCNASFFRAGIFCNPSTVTVDRNFSVAFNLFHSNYRHAVWISPLVNTVGILTNNTFSNHSLGAVRIDNGYDLLISRWYRQFRVNYSIFENTFENNRGRYALNVRLTQDAPFQAMEVKFNRFRNNFIQDSFMYLNPRSRANAVAVVSSSNVRFQRNWVENPNSVRQIATHLIDPSVTIDARYNWWGVEVTSSAHFQPIHAGIFDQDDRYNLARMDYMPVLNSPQLYDSYTSSDITYKWPFMRGDYLGGILENDFTVPSGRTYHVDQDIYINPTARLTLGQGARLLFNSAVGLLAHGRLGADGQSKAGTITFDLYDDPDSLPIENRTASVRLVDGVDEYEGRLEVELSEGWGTVCNLGWREQNALLACQQLGLTYYPQLGRAMRRVTAASDVTIALSWVRCDDTDLDLMRCRHSGEVDQGCTHAMDVFIRCQPATWAGVTIPAIPRGSQFRETTIRHVILRRAGMLDHATMSLTPALRIDYNFYQISFITVENALSDAIHIKYHHPTASKLLEYANLTSNGGNGLVTRTPGLVVQYSTVTGSGGAGFLYDPFFTEYEALIVRNSIHPDRRQQDITRTPSFDLTDQMSFLVCSPGSGEEDHTYYTQITATTLRGLVTLQVLDFFPNTTIERVTVFDASRDGITASSKGWRIPEDLIDFPVVSTGKELTIQFKVKGVRSGRLTFAVIPIDVTDPLPRLETRMVNCTFSNNEHGIITKHYNDPFNEKFDIFFRPANEFIYFERVLVLNSRQYAVHMPSVTKYHDDYIPTYEDLTTPQRVASITYDIIQCKFHNNGYGIFAEHNHVDFANNVWHWRISQSEIVSCGEGGFEAELPRVNDDGKRLAHSVIVNETLMRNNKKFAFTIAGYYANITIRRNDFRDNVCRKGLMTVSGMEKDMLVRENSMQRNTGRYVMDLDITSHAEYSAPVVARLEFNDISYNSPDVPNSGVSPTTYAVAFRGLQNISAARNLFENPGLGYELVAGVMSLSLGNPVDVRENWWGTTNELQIRNRTFDFDDWNNYAIALYYPYLTRRDFLSDVSPGSPIDIPLDLTRLGGRVAESLVIPYKPTPYVVYSDLTVMPNAILTLEAGTELLFRPNVGILVLGTLVARGTPQARIKLRPQPRSAQPQALTSQPQAEATPVSGTLRLRGDGKLFKNAGFLEFYNASSNSWNLMCDSQFNEKTAEVVCRQLGKETINVRVRYTHLYDHYIYGEPQYFRKEFWFYSYFCRGDENNMEQCTKRYNYNLLPCIYAANYTFVTCGDRNLEPQYDYWGNIRFSTDTFDEQILAVTTFDKESILEYVDIEGAGMLHGEKVGAVQATYKTPIFRYINITKSACNGYDVIAPRDTLEITYQNVSGNLGYGINILMLNGESSERASSFLPLGASTIPYYVFGLVEMCRMEKEIQLRNRAIVYYKYSARAVDCVKIIHSDSPRKRIGLRFLQLRLFQEDFSRNSIEIFDGQVVSDATMVKEILPNASSTELLQLYSSTGSTLTLHVHASVSHGSYGFVAEIVTLPPVGLTYPGSDYKHQISDTILLRNEEGALQYKNVGEINPSVFVTDCWMEGNGVAILNLTSPPTLDFSLQGTKAFVFHRNFVARNKGGMYVNAHTMSMPAALRGNITNNVFAFGSHGEALNLTGHYFQRFYVFQNFIFNYTTGDFRDVVHVRDVVVNFTYNSVLRHEAHYILSAYNNDDRGAIQEYVSNGFYDNNSTALLESTIKVGRGYPRFHYNYIVNDMNDFEMETSPKIEARDSGVEAEENWWGSDQRSFITGKIWDSGDSPQLGSVNFWPPRFSNSSVVDSVCPQGWKHDNGQCFRYMGAALPYAEAQQFCLELGGSLANVRGRHDLLYYVLRLMASDYSDSLRAWVQGEVGGARCGVIERNYFVEELDCWRTLYPFICQKDPTLSPPSSGVLAMALGIGIGVGGAILLVAIIIGVMWCVKSRRRKQERFERAASIRSSIRGSVRSKSQLTILTEGAASRRHLDMLDERSMSQSTVGKSSLGSTSYLGSQHSLAQARRADKDPRRYHSNESLDRDPGRAPNYRLQTMPDRRPPVPRMGAAYRGRGGRDPKRATDDDDEYYTDSTFDDLEDEKKINLSDRRYANVAFEPSPTETPVVKEEEDDEEDEEEEEEEEEKSGVNASRKSLTSFSGDSTPDDSTPVKQKPFALPPYNLPPPPPSPPLSKDSPPPPYKHFSRDDRMDSGPRPQPQPRQDSLPPKPQPRGPKPSTAPRPRQLNMAANPPQRTPHDSSSDLEPWNRPYEAPEPARPVEDSPPRTLYEQYRDKNFRADPPGPTLQPARSNPSLHSGEQEPVQRPMLPRHAPAPYRDASPHPSVGSHEGELGRPAESRAYRPNPQYLPAQGRAPAEPLSDVDTPRSYPSIPPPAYQPPAMPSLQPGVEEMRASPFPSQFPSSRASPAPVSMRSWDSPNTSYSTSGSSQPPYVNSRAPWSQPPHEGQRLPQGQGYGSQKSLPRALDENGPDVQFMQRRPGVVLQDSRPNQPIETDI